MEPEFEIKTAVKVNVLPVHQRIGTFYVGVVKASEAVQICSAEPRHAEEQDALVKYTGIQRPLKKERVEEIKSYVKTWDATFPNSIILAVNKGSYMLQGENVMYIRRDKLSCSIIDGQHRLAGFSSSDENSGDFQLILSLFPEMEVVEQAYLFSVINTRMTRINPSLAQDLLEFSRIDTPEKLAHDLAKEFNDRDDSPWLDKIKMLGKREINSNAVLSQSTFCREIIDLICDTRHSHEIRNILMESNNDRSKLLGFGGTGYESKYIFWKPFIERKDKYIYTVLENYFRAASNVFSAEWNSGDNILTKTTGYSALMKVFEKIYKKGASEKDLTEEFFKKLFTLAKESHQVKELNSDNYLGGAGESKLAADLLKGMGLQQSV